MTVGEMTVYNTTVDWITTDLMTTIDDMTVQ
jgi:hypothetical protein